MNYEHKFGKVLDVNSVTRGLFIIVQLPPTAIPQVGMLLKNDYCNFKIVGVFIQQDLKNDPKYNSIFWKENIWELMVKPEIIDCKIVKGSLIELLDNNDSYT
jgi:hypothetical protein